MFFGQVVRNIFLIKDMLTRRDLVSKKCISSNLHVFIVQNMSRSILRILDSVFEGGGTASPKGKRIGSFLVPKLCHLWMEWIQILWTQLLYSTCRAKCSNILHDIFICISSVFSARHFLQLLDEILSAILKKKCSYNIFFLHLNVYSLTSYFHYILKN
jgi:hypothetical protein